MNFGQRKRPTPEGGPFHGTRVFAVMVPQRCSWRDYDYEPIE